MWESDIATVKDVAASKIEGKVPPTFLYSFFSQLRREIEVWQQKHDVYCTDEKELEELYRTSQKKYNKFAASLPSR